MSTDLSLSNVVQKELIAIRDGIHLGEFFNFVAGVGLIVTATPEIYNAVPNFIDSIPYLNTAVHWVIEEVPRYVPMLVTFGGLFINSIINNSIDLPPLYNITEFNIAYASLIEGYGQPVEKNTGEDIRNLETELTTKFDMLDDKSKRIAKDTIYRKLKEGKTFVSQALIKIAFGDSYTTLATMDLDEPRIYLGKESARELFGMFQDYETCYLKDDRNYGVTKADYEKKMLWVFNRMPEFYKPELLKELTRLQEKYHQKASGLNPIRDALIS